MLLAILDEGLFSMTYTWLSQANHTSDKDALPDKLKRAIMAVARMTLNAPGRKMTVTEFVTMVRNQFSGNRLRVGHVYVSSFVPIAIVFPPSPHQYVRKMQKLLEEGKLPPHVDPSAIINAPASKRPRDGNDAAISGNFASRESPLPAEGNQGVEERSADNPPRSRARRRRSSSPSTSNSADAALLAGLSSDSDADDHFDVIRSSSPSEDEGLED